MNLFTRSSLNFKTLHIIKEIAGLLFLVLFFTISSCKKENDNKSGTSTLIESRELTLTDKLSKGFSKYISVDNNRGDFYALIPRYDYGFGEKLFLSLLQNKLFSSNFTSAYNEANGSNITDSDLKTLIKSVNPFICVRIRGLYKGINNFENLTPLIRDIPDLAIYKSGILVDNDLEVGGVSSGQVPFTIDIDYSQSQKFINVSTKNIVFEPNNGEYNWMLQSEVMSHIKNNCQLLEGDIYIADIIQDLQKIAKVSWLKLPPVNPPVNPPLSPCARDDNNEANSYMSLKLTSPQVLYAFGNNPCEFGIGLSGLIVGNINNFSNSLEEFYDFKLVTQWATPTGSIGGSSVHKIFVTLFQLVDAPAFTVSQVNGGPYGNYTIFTMSSPGFTNTLEYPLDLPLFAFGDTWIANTWNPSLIGDVVRISMFEADPCTWNYQSGTSEVSSGTTSYSSSVTANFAQFGNLVVNGSQVYSHTNTTTSNFTVSSSNNYEIGSVLYSYCWAGNIHEVSFGNILKLKLKHNP